MSALHNLMDIDVVYTTANESRVCITSNETQSDYICANYIDVRINAFFIILTLLCI